MATTVKGSFIAILALLCFLPFTSLAATPQGLEDQIIKLQNQVNALQLLVSQTITQSSPVDLKVKGSDGPLSFSGRKKISFTWTATGVKNCHLQVARGKDYNVSPVGEKRITVSSDAPYVVLSCNSIKTGEAISDYVNIIDPKGRSAFSVITDDSNTITATASGELIKKVCAADTFKIGTISWGDGETDLVVPELKDGTCSKEVSDTQTHYYSNPGTYKVVFKDWAKRKHSEEVTID
jgi:hypothetical protein